MVIKTIVATLLSAWLLVATGPTMAQNTPKASGTTPSRATESAPSRNPAMEASQDDYRIGTHDLLEVSVFQAPDLSRTVRVNSTGVITLPMIGAVKAGGLTAFQLEEVIANKYGQDHLQEPQVSIFIKEYVSQRVVIEGKVKKTGVYPITGRTTLLQALALAEGLDQLANENAVKIFRLGSEGQREMQVYDLTDIRGGRVEDPLVKGNDVVVVEEAAGRAVVKSITDTLRGFFNFGTLGY